MQGIEVRCGQCMACRITRSAEWGARLMHELPYFEQRCFATFTYDWGHVPRTRGNRGALTLRKVDLQLALKRLRKALDGRQVKYFGCGEYGDQFGRPHYHLIVLGVGVSEHEFSKRGLMKGIAVSGPLVDMWPHGHVFIGTAEADSIRYVADYLKKAWKGKRAVKVYRNCERPFQCISQGIGKRFALKNARQLRANLGLTVKGAQVGLPRYYRKVLDITGDNSPDLVKRARSAALENLEHVVSRVLEKGVPGGSTLEGAIREWIAAARRQRDAGLIRKAELRKKGSM